MKNIRFYEFLCYTNSKKLTDRKIEGVIMELKANNGEGIDSWK